MQPIVILRLAALVGAVVCAAPQAADAFCGFYINGAGSEMFNDATQVVMMRKGTRTVLSMQNNYQGPPAAFAMVIPVPTILQEADVKTLPKDVFGRVDIMGAPRLVEYWEQDPCGRDDWDRRERRMPLKRSAPPAMGMAGATAEDLGVTVEAKFEVGEYQIVILSAKDASGLDTWLRREQYQIPKGAQPFLRPYVESGMKFFVAKVDPKKVAFDADGRAALSPLRFHYDSEDFNLPIRLGLVNSSGTQDLIVSILAPNQRYQVANYQNVTIPTNLDVRDAVRTSFGSFYASLYDATVKKHPGAVVTEYAWAASTCDPCPGPTLGGNDFALLGADVLEGTTAKPAPYGGWDFVLTRLHARYGKNISEDLVFKVADPIVGGREQRGSGGRLEARAQVSSINNFQARYAIRHWWTGSITCKAPRRGVWGGPPNGRGVRPTPALGLAFAKRGKSLPGLLVSNVPEIGIKAYRKKPKPKAAKPPPAPPRPAVEAPDPTVKGAPMGALRQGCSTGGTPDLGALAAVAAMLVATRRRKRS